jgi:competence protein ComGC
MSRFFLALLLLAPVPTSAKDVALILNDQNRAALAQVLDLATKAYGLQVASVTVQLKTLLDAAPEVTQQTPATPDVELKNTQEPPK